MDIREALYTTRAMRRVKPDPIPDDVQQRIIDAAIRAPSGGNAQTWRFLLVDDADQIAKIGAIYSECIDMLWATVYKEQADAVKNNPDDPELASFGRIMRSVEWAQENFATYPLLLFGFAQFDSSGGSIFPAIWSAMLAARAEGVGSSLTSVLAFKQDDVYELLGVPAEEDWRMACCVPMGYPTGKWGIAAREPAQDVTFRNSWGTSTGWNHTAPLWSE